MQEEMVDLKLRNLFKMSVSELSELKKQLEELLETPILFILHMNSKFFYFFGIYISFLSLSKIFIFTNVSLGPCEWKLLVSKNV